MPLSCHDSRLVIPHGFIWISFCFPVESTHVCSLNGWLSFPTHFLLSESFILIAKQIVIVFMFIPFLLHALCSSPSMIPSVFRMRTNPVSCFLRFSPFSVLRLFLMHVVFLSIFPLCPCLSLFPFFCMLCVPLHL